MRCCLSFIIVGLLAVPIFGQAIPDAITTIKKVDQRGAGTTEAQAATRILNAAKPSALPTIAYAMKGTNPLAANWLRSAFEIGFDRAMKNELTIPQDRLLAFVKDTEGDPRARRMVFEWLSKLDNTLPDQLIPEMLLDPSSEFRRDAVARLIDEAKSQNKRGDEKAAMATFTKALRGAIHEDQVKSIVEPLEKLGTTVDVQKHFGFLPTWNVIGPFDNRDKKGFPVVYPPEQEINLKNRYDSEYAKQKVTWKRFSTDDDYGIFDIAKKTENHKGSVTYATADYVSDAEKQVELRLGTPNAWKLWLNGKLIFEREEYHRSTRMDQYKLPVKLKRGTNRILLKICQNEQDDSWAQDYHFQLRVCDATGSGLLSAVTKTTSRTDNAGVNE